MLNGNTTQKLYNDFMFLLYLIFLFLVCFTIVVNISGIYWSTTEGLDYAWGWGRSIATIVLLVGFNLYTNSNILADSDVHDRIGNGKTLHFLSVITFIVSVIVSVFSSQILVLMRSWSQRTGTILADKSVDLLVAFPSLNLIYTTFVCSILCLFFAHGRHAHRLSISLQKEQKEQSKNLRDAIRVAPPPYFTKMLADMSDQAEDFHILAANEYEEFESFLFDEDKTEEEKQQFSEITIEKQRKTIRAILTAFGRLARAYDNVNPMDASSDIEYRANLMLSVAPDGEALDAIFPSNKLVNRFAVPFDAKPEYLLVVDNRLSVKINKTSPPLFVEVGNSGSVTPEIEPYNFTKDSNVKNALLPVYWSEQDKSFINYNMIGAPIAIATGTNQFIPDTHIAITASTHYPEDIQQKALNYFKTDDKGRSIVSLPVATRHFKCHPNEEALPSSYFGTINLYRNKPNIFSGHVDNFQFFSDFTRPLSLILGRVTMLHIVALIKQQQIKGSDK
ncbi:MAG: hypothetical protein ACJAXS_001640 [Colwellia sp.]|jgi:hypothetical protein